MANNAMDLLSAIDDNGNPVDWWFIYKVAGKSVASDKSKPKGTEYIYYDSNFPADKKLQLSPNLIDDPKAGAVSNTLNQIYNNLSNPDLGWFFYNDEDPITGKTNSSRGHTKGVLCFNHANDSAFWLIHSTPKFPLKGAYGFPKTGMGNAQTFLCISLKNSDQAKNIAQQMYQGQQPNVYLASAVPAALKNINDIDPRVELINDTVQPGTKAYADSLTFFSRSGFQFLCIAKNKYWHTTGDDDFYNDLVAVKLNENIEVETWGHDPAPPETDHNSTHTVLAMQSVDLAPLGTTPSYDWSEENDHAKLVVSDKGEAINYICVGDINFTIAQENRSGGTAAFPCTGLWESLIEILSTTKILSNKTTATKSKTAKPAPAKKSKAAKKSPVKKKSPTVKKKTTVKKAVPAKKTKPAAKKAAAKKSPVKKKAAKKK